MNQIMEFRKMYLRNELLIKAKRSHMKEQKISQFSFLHITRQRNQAQFYPQTDQSQNKSSCEGETKLLSRTQQYNILLETSTFFHHEMPTWRHQIRNEF